MSGAVKGLSSFVIPPWLKFVPIILAVLLIGVQWKMIADRNDKITVFEDNRAVLAQELKVPARHVNILGAIKAVKQESEYRRVTLETISREALLASTRSKEADKRLADAQAANRKAQARSAATIKALESRKGSGDAVKDLKAIEEDSKSPWKGWQAQGFANFYQEVPLNDDHVWRAAQYGRKVVQVEIVIHPTYQNLRYNYEVRSRKQIGMTWLAAFSVERRDGTCEMHVMDPRVDLKAWTWGHELLHCVYGSWHRERI